MSGEQLKNKFTPATTILNLLQEAFGPSWVLWEAETIYLGLQNHYGMTHVISDENKSCIQAVKTLMTNNLYFEDLLGFEKITLGLNNIVPTFDHLEVASPGEIYYGMSMVNILLGDVDFTALSDEVRVYIQACFKESGQAVFPESLNFLQDPKHQDLVSEVRQRAEQLKQLGSSVDTDDVVSVQAAKLHDCEAYTRARIDEARKELVPDD
jgi:hypothetical protein